MGVVSRDTVKYAAMLAVYVAPDEVKHSLYNFKRLWSSPGCPFVRQTLDHRVRFPLMGLFRLSSIIQLIIYEYAFFNIVIMSFFSVNCFSRHLKIDLWTLMSRHHVLESIVTLFPHPRLLLS